MAALAALAGLPQPHYEAEPGRDTVWLGASLFLEATDMSRLFRLVSTHRADSIRVVAHRRAARGRYSIQADVTFSREAFSAAMANADTQAKFLIKPKAPRAAGQ